MASRGFRGFPWLAALWLPSRLAFGSVAVASYGFPLCGFRHPSLSASLPWLPVASRSAASLSPRFRCRGFPWLPALWLPSRLAFGFVCRGCHGFLCLFALWLPSPLASGSLAVASYGFRSRCFLMISAALHALPLFQHITAVCEVGLHIPFQSPGPAAPLYHSQGFFPTSWRRGAARSEAPKVPPLSWKMFGRSPGHIPMGLPGRSPTRAEPASYILSTFLAV